MDVLDGVPKLDEALQLEGGGQWVTELSAGVHSEIALLSQAPVQESPHECIGDTRASRPPPAPY